MLFSKTISQFFQQLGYTRSRSDSTLFTKHDPKRGWVMVTLFVDDCLLTGTSDEMIKELRQNLIDRFSDKLTWNSRVTSFLGVACKQSDDNKTFTMSAGAKVRDLMEKLKWKEITLKRGGAKTGRKEFTAPTPWCAEFSNIKANENRTLDYRQEQIKNQFRTITGTLIYLSITVRPDLCPYLNKACRGQADPKRLHIVLVERLLLYLNHTVDHGLVYRANGNLVETEIIGPLSRQYPELKRLADTKYVMFTDANFADATDERLRSTTGWCLYCFGCLISWKSTRQTLTAKSTLESEIIAAASASDEACWFHCLIESLSFCFDFPADSPPPPVPLLMDNTAALATSNHPMTTQASKHLDLRVFRIRDAQGDTTALEPGEERPVPRIRCYWCPTKTNIADFFSKLLQSCDFQRLGRFVVDLHYNPSADVSGDGELNYILPVADEWPEEFSQPPQLYLAESPDSFELFVKQLPPGPYPDPHDMAKFDPFEIFPISTD